MNEGGSQPPKLLFTAWGVAGIIGPRIGGVLFDKYRNYQMAFYTAGILAAIALLCELAAKRPAAPEAALAGKQERRCQQRLSIRKRVAKWHSMLHYARARWVSGGARSSERHSTAAPMSEFASLKVSSAPELDLVVTQAQKRKREQVRSSNACD